MANPTMVPAPIFHVRSTSMPSISHPLMFKIEEELHKLNACAVASSASASSTTFENACKNLNGLADIYRCVDEVLHLPSISQAFSRSNEKKWLEKELDISVKLLDLCSTIKDMLVRLAENAEEIQLDNHRRLYSVSEEFICSQVYSRKEIRKNIMKCHNQLKRVENMHPSNVSSCDLPAIARVLMETRDLTVYLLGSVLSCLSTPGSRKKVSLISKALNSRKVACVVKRENAQHVVGSENGAYNICFREVEAGLEELFRQLIRNRVSLLNLLSF